MGHIDGVGEQFTDNEIALLAALDALTTSTATQAIRKSSATTFANVDLGVTWGSITGTLSNQTDLQTALDARGLTASPLSQFAATTSAQLAGVISDETGSGVLVFATSPTLITPVLGAATATTLNGLTVTTSTGTLTISNGKTFTASNTITLSGTDSVAMNVTNNKIRSVGITIDGGGSAITTGVKGYIEVPYACTISAVTLLADVSGSIVVDIWKDTYANYPPTVADTITASAKPTITTAVKSQDTTLTGWTTSVAAGDILAFNVDSITTCTRVHLILKVTAT